MDALNQIHEMLKEENASGGITRQEAVSMAPPLFLDIELHHKILDTCAAPGSKTVQMLEMLHEAGGLPSGFVIANDSETQRCNLLVHQTKRMQSPALVVTNHDASAFPLLKRHKDPKAAAMYFDRILCDVPCSGDGTLRKAPDLWRRWNINQGTGLHALQVRITLHSASLLKVGGRMVYSTCSFNPVEDEAVVAEVLRQSGGALELLDVAERLPNFPRCPGIKRWHLKGTKGEFFDTLEAAEEASNANSFSPSMFPDAESDLLPLERCMRVLPHHGDTGGFFIAVMQKKSEIPPLQADRWKRVKDRMMDKRREYKELKVASEKLQTKENAIPDGSQAVPSSGGEAKREGCNQEPIAGANDADQAPMTLTDAKADQDLHAAIFSPTEPLAAEAVADQAEKLDGGNTRESTASVGGDAQTVQEDEAAPAETEAAAAPGTAAVAPGRRQKQKRVKPGEEPIQADVDPKILDSIFNFFGLEASFPMRQQLVTRSGATEDKTARKIYFVTSGITEMVSKDEEAALKVAAAGLKVFEKNDKRGDIPCAYRLSQEGLRAILPYVTKQVIQPTAAEMLRILKDRYISVPKTEDGDPEPDSQPPAKKIKPEAEPADGDDSKVEAETPACEDEPPTKKSKTEFAPSSGGNENPAVAASGKEPAELVIRIPLDDPHTLHQLSQIQRGCTILTLRDEEARELGLQGEASTSGGPFYSQITIVCWTGKSSIAILVDKPTSAQLAARLEYAMQVLAARKPKAGLVA